MSKAILISIHPKWCEKIVSGQKTIEVRKTRPNIKTPFKCYIYQTKHKWICSFLRFVGMETFAELLDDSHGKIIGEFVCNGMLSHCESSNADLAEQQGCIRMDKLFDYAQGKELYGWHISDLVIYDKHRELREFKGRKLVWRGNNHIHAYETLTRPPQSWCYVDEL